MPVINAIVEPAFASLCHALERYHANAQGIVHGRNNGEHLSDSTNTAAILFFMAEHLKAGERFPEQAELPERVSRLQSLIAGGTVPQQALRAIHADVAARYYEMHHRAECGQPYSALREM